jgi:hypothetical protein
MGWPNSVQDAIDDLREQELLEQQLSSTAALNVELMERIAELEDERMDAAMLDQYRIWYTEEKAKVKLYEAAFRQLKIDNHKAIYFNEMASMLCIEITEKKIKELRET